MKLIRPAQNSPSSTESHFENILKLMCALTDQSNLFFILYRKIVLSPRGERETETYIISEIFVI